MLHRLLHKVGTNANVGVTYSNVLYQRATVTLAATQASPTTPTTITSTTTSLTGVFSYGASASTSDAVAAIKDYLTRTTITSTTLTNTRTSSTAAVVNITFAYGLMQFSNRLVESIQTITGTLTTTQGTPTVANLAIPTPVTKSRSVVLFQEETSINVNSNTVANIHHIVDIDAGGNNVTVQASTLLTSITRNFSVQVIQFKSAAVKNKYDYTVTIATGSASGTASLSSLNSGSGVTTSNTILFPRGQVQTGTASSSVNVAFSGTALTNATTITSTRGGSSGTLGLTIQGTALECNSGYISVQHSSATIASSGTTTSTTITSYNTSKTFLLHCGWYSTYTSSASAGEEGIWRITLALPSSTSWSMTRTVADATTVTCPVQIITHL
jgi:hypothetical protein